MPYFWLFFIFFSIFLGKFVSKKSKMDFCGEVGLVRGFSIDNGPKNADSDNLESAKNRLSSTS